MILHGRFLSKISFAPPFKLEDIMFKLGNFRFMVATDDALKKETFRLRHHIYVEELGFEKSDACPDGYETDIYDDCSIHFAVVDDDTGMVIATSRVILNSEIGLPITTLEDVFFVGDKSILDKIIEVSRFAVHANYRRRKEDIRVCHLPPMPGNPFDRRSSDRGTPDRRKRPVILYGMFRLVYQISRQMGITYVCIISERFLFEALAHMGFIFYPIGPEVDFHGLRTPYIAFLDELEDYWIAEKPEFMLFISEGLEEKYWPKNDRFHQLMERQETTADSILQDIREDN